MKRTILWDLPRPALQQQPRSSSSRFDEFYRSGVRHVPGALPIDFNDLISYLLIKETFSQPKTVRLNSHFQQVRKASVITCAQGGAEQFSCSCLLLRRGKFPAAS